VTTMRGHDDREMSADANGDRLAYLVLSFGILAIVAYRSFVREEASWDLLGLVVLGGLVGGGYRLSRGAITRQAAVLIGLTFVVALAVAIMVLTVAEPGLT
jgi:hypothetical protein